MTHGVRKLALAFALSLPLGLAACGEEDSADTVSEKLDEATQSAGDAASDIKDAAQGAADVVEDKVDSASDAVGKAVDDAKKDLENTGSSSD